MTKGDARSSAVVCETPEGLLITAPPSSKRRADSWLLVGLGMAFGLIALASVARSPLDRDGLVLGLSGTLGLWGWALWRWATWVEILVQPTERVIVRRRQRRYAEPLVLGRLPFAELGAVRVTVRDDYDDGPYGELYFVRLDGKLWAKVRFDSAHQARRARARILETIAQEGSK